MTLKSEKYNKSIFSTLEFQLLFFLLHMFVAVFFIISMKI